VVAARPVDLAGGDRHIRTAARDLRRGACQPCERGRVRVGAYIAAAYYFTSAKSFANPAVTIARTFSDAFAGIEPASAPMFVVAQLVGAAVALATVRVIYPDIGEVADQVVVPHDAAT
jgi:hypothetical protein